jgi:TolA-binding protein
MASKDAKFYQEAKYELGRAYVKVGDETKARDVFNQILAIENSSFAAQSLIELGMIERNRNNADKAIAYYKRVVEQMPMSEYADDALLAIESIYQSKNEPETYLAYIESIGKSSLKTEDEREQMIFNAAEQIFLSGDYAKALASLQNYETKYPNGVLLSKAHFYTAESYKQLGNLESACDFYSKVITNGSGSFVEIAMLNFANISYSLQEYDEAYTAYSNLYDKALLDDNKYTALKGMMNSTYAGKDYHRSVKYAQQVAADRRSDDFQVLKARYIEAKSYLAMSDRTQAFKILEELALDPKSAEGAEANLLIIQDFYDKGEFTKVEEKVYEFSDAGTPQVYFLAKSFIILGDSFVERGEFEQAKATFESVRDGYTPSEKGDDVLEEVKMRLDKLVELMSQPSAQ